jgi:hypothetical protein
MIERKEDNPDITETGPMEYKVQIVTVILTALSTLLLDPQVFLG